MNNMEIKNKSAFFGNALASKILLAVSSIVGDKVFDSAGSQLGQITNVIVNFADKKIESIVLQRSYLVDPHRSFRRVAFDALSVHPANEFIIEGSTEC